MEAHVVHDIVTGILERLHAELQAPLGELEDLAQRTLDLSADVTSLTQDLNSELSEWRKRVQLLN
ncbi:MAG: hypothetical protein ACK56I_30345, partial [bacterium]